jgi:hypothetical protein
MLLQGSVIPSCPSDINDAVSYHPSYHFQKWWFCNTNSVVSVASYWVLHFCI